MACSILGPEVPVLLSEYTIVASFIMGKFICKVTVTIYRCTIVMLFISVEKTGSQMKSNVEVFGRRREGAHFQPVIWLTVVLSTAV